MLFINCLNHFLEITYAWCVVHVFLHFVLMLFFVEVKMINNMWEIFMWWKLMKQNVFMGLLLDVWLHYMYQLNVFNDLFCSQYKIENIFEHGNQTKQVLSDSGQCPYYQDQFRRFQIKWIIACQWRVVLSFSDEYSTCVDVCSTSPACWTGCWPIHSRCCPSSYLLTPANQPMRRLWGN